MKHLRIIKFKIIYNDPEIEDFYDIVTIPYRENLIKTYKEAHKIIRLFHPKARRYKLIKIT